ncbi:MAG: transporter related [Gammaproteobacteria bacterium]|nr:transporter related [Gammaproteobacteria bacterium]
MSALAVEVEGLGKHYLLGANRQRADTLRDLIAAAARSALTPGARAVRQRFWALKGATFRIAQGESVGIIGLNGAGKSTLLKMLAGIIEPSEGWARICGRVGALLEVGTGFHWELTGRENVYLYGSILGMSRREIACRFDAIVAFAEMAQFIDTPVKRYSSGMYVRLAFSVAAQLEPEILLIDEVLAVGDLSFQRKCTDFARNLQKRSATIVCVSHNMHSIKTMCDRVIYLRKGSVVFDGPTERGLELYEKDCRLSDLAWIGTPREEWPIEITGCELIDENGICRSVWDFGKPLRVRISFNAKRMVADPNFIVAFTRADGVVCCNYSSEADGIAAGQITGPGRIEIEAPPLKLVSDMYSVSVLVRERGFGKIVCGQVGATFHVRHALFDTHFGVYHEPATWRFCPAGADKHGDSAIAPSNQGHQPGR